MSVILVHTERFAEHQTPPGHPERSERAEGKDVVVDYDVHHGNGTQHIFEADPHVLYVSTHQYPYYPGTGAAEEIGRDAGRGFTVNLPIEAGAVDEDYQLAFERVVLPVVRQF